MSLVVDASAALRVADRTQPGHEDAVACLRAALAADIRPIAPHLYAYEVGSVLSRGPRSETEKMRVYGHALELVALVHPGPEALRRAMRVAADKKLSFYDAGYLALAEENDCQLWTEDREIIKRFPGRCADTAEMLRKLRVK